MGLPMSRSSRYLILVGKLVFLIEMAVFLALEKNEYVHVKDTLPSITLSFQIENH